MLLWLLKPNSFRAKVYPFMLTFLFAALLSFVSFQAISLKALWESASVAQLQSLEATGARSEAARNISITTSLLAASAATALFVVSFAVMRYGCIDECFRKGVLHETLIVLDVVSDAGLAMVAASIVGPRADCAADFARVHSLVEASRRQQIRQRMECVQTE